MLARYTYLLAKMECKKLPDAELLWRIRAGDPSAFNPIYDSYRRNILDLALGKLRSIEDAADITQETFLRAFQSVDDLHAPVLPWLYTTARNLCYDLLRRKWRHMELHDERAYSDTPGIFNTLSQSETPHDLLERSLLVQRLIEAFEQLPAKNQEVMLLFLNEDNFSEAARARDMNVATLKSRLHRARLYMRRALPDMHEFCYA